MLGVCSLIDSEKLLKAAQYTQYFQQSVAFYWLRHLGLSPIPEITHLSSMVDSEWKPLWREIVLVGQM